MSNKNNFLQLIQSKIGCGYVLGSQGQIMTDKLLNVLKYNYPKDRVDANYKVALKWIGQICFDCSGLVIWTLQQLNILTSNQDYSASGIYSNLCTPIKKEELKAGDLVFVNGSNGITHIGIYMGNGRVTHARGTFYGVVNTALFDSFNVFGRLKCFESEQEEEGKDMTVKEFQALRKIEVDDVVGKQTIAEFLKVAEDYYRIKQILSELVKGV